MIFCRIPRRRSKRSKWGECRNIQIIKGAVVLVVSMSININMNMNTST